MENKYIRVEIRRAVVFLSIAMVFVAVQVQSSSETSPMTTEGTIVLAAASLYLLVSFAFEAVQRLGGE
jgi:hypothetical protein